MSRLPSCPTRMDFSARTTDTSILLKFEEDISKDQNEIHLSQITLPLSFFFASGRLEKGADPHSRKFVLVREANYHPDGGQVFYPITKQPFVLLLALPGDDIKLDDFMAFYCDGTCGLQIKVNYFAISACISEDSVRHMLFILNKSINENQIHSSQFLIFWFGQDPFCVATAYPNFGLSVTFPMGFKARVDLSPALLAGLHAVNIKCHIYCYICLFHQWGCTLHKCVCVYSKHTFQTSLITNTGVYVMCFPAGLPFFMLPCLDPGHLCGSAARCIMWPTQFYSSTGQMVTTSAFQIEDWDSIPGRVENAGHVLLNH